MLWRFARKIAAQSVRRSHHKGRAARGIRKMFACIFAQKLVFTRTRARSGENNYYAKASWIRTVCALPYAAAKAEEAAVSDDVTTAGCSDFRAVSKLPLVHCPVPVS